MKENKAKTQEWAHWHVSTHMLMRGKARGVRASAMETSASGGSTGAPQG